MSALLDEGIEFPSHLMSSPSSDQVTSGWDAPRRGCSCWRPSRRRRSRPATSRRRGTGRRPWGSARPNRRPTASAPAWRPVRSPVGGTRRWRRWDRRGRRTRRPSGRTPSPRRGPRGSRCRRPVVPESPTATCSWIRPSVAPRPTGHRSRWHRRTSSAIRRSSSESRTQEIALSSGYQLVQGVMVLDPLSQHVTASPSRNGAS